jgi:hypothetical protein
VRTANFGAFGISPLQLAAVSWLLQTPCVRLQASSAFTIVLSSMTMSCRPRSVPGPPREESPGAGHDFAGSHGSWSFTACDGG